MQRISTTTRVVNKFGAGKHGFTNGDVVGGVPATDLEAALFDNLQEELANVVEGVGTVLNGATLTQLKDAIDIMIRRQAGAVCTAAGTADAITGALTPAVTALVNGSLVSVRAASANATTTPTFKADGTALKTIVKGNNLALAIGDIAGAGHLLQLQYDLTLDRWVLLNPAVATAANDAAGADNSTRVASTGWIRNSMAAIATAAGFHVLFAGIGHIRFPSWLGSLQICWGTGVTGGAGGGSATFSLSFPTACYACFPCIRGNGNTTINMVSFSVSGTNVAMYNASTGAGQSENFGYWAIGK